MRHLFLLPLILLAPLGLRVIAQNCPPPDSTRWPDIHIIQYEHEHWWDTTLSSFMLNTYDADRTPSYFGPMIMNNASVSHDAVAPLVDGEGRLGDLFEAAADLYFPIVSGRNDPRFFAGGFRIGTIFSTTVRMADDRSHPLLPGNWKIGLGGELPLHYKGYAGFHQRIESKLKEYAQDINDLPDDSTRRESRKRLERDRRMYRRNQLAPFMDTTWAHSRFLFGTWRLYHYSNGQDGDFYADSVLHRNNYRTGDFSTNCLEGKLNHAWRFPSTALLTAGVGFRWDLGLGGVLEFSPQQQRAYGQWRWTGHAQLRTKPFWSGWYIGKRFWDEKTNCQHRLREQFEARIRLEVDHVAGDMSRYPHQGQLNRTGAHLWLEAVPLRSYTTGFFIHAYRGRDYLNIRYDRAVTLLMAGFTFNLVKYIPYGWHSASAIEPRNGRAK